MTHASHCATQLPLDAVPNDYALVLKLKRVTGSEGDSGGTSTASGGDGSGLAPIGDGAEAGAGAGASAGSSSGAVTTVGWTYVKLGDEARMSRELVLTLFQRPTDLKLNKRRPLQCFVTVDIGLWCE